MGDVAEIATVAWGYTMADIERLARRVANGSKSFGVGAICSNDRREEAWCGIVERLYSATEYPAPAVLLEAGREAVSKQLSARDQSHGLRSDGEGGHGPGFMKYWRTVSSSSDDFTDGLAERLALPQVLALLTDVEYEAIMARAAHATLEQGAAALGIPTRTLRKRLDRARTKVTAAWLAPETPRAKPTRGADVCKYGHSRAEHGYRTSADAWVCRICARNKHRRLRARGR